MPKEKRKPSIIAFVVKWIVLILFALFLAAYTFRQLSWS